MEEKKEFYFDLERAASRMMTVDKVRLSKAIELIEKEMIGFIQEINM